MTGSGEAEAEELELLAQVLLEKEVLLKSPQITFLPFHCFSCSKKASTCDACFINPVFNRSISFSELASPKFSF